jgi:hypothetical protein
VFNAANSSSADALTVAVGARGTFEVDLPASTPFSILPGSSILAQVGVEKWRFGLFVRTLVKVTVPTLPMAEEIERYRRRMADDARHDFRLPGEREKGVQLSHRTRFRVAERESRRR